MSDSIDKVDARKEKSLKQICFQAVRKHFVAVGTASIVDLPTHLIKDLLPHLTVCQLDELQPVLNHRGISTLSGWIGVLLDLCGPNHVLDLATEEQAKHKVMKMLFSAVFYGFTNCYIKKNMSNLNTPSFLRVAAKHLRRFSLLSINKPLQALTMEKRSFLSHLEEWIDSVVVSQCVALVKKEAQTVLYILHRLLDHGVARKLTIHVQCPIILAWLLHERGTRHLNPRLKSLMSSPETSSAHNSVYRPRGKSKTVENQDHPAVPCKLQKLDSESLKEELTKNANLTLDREVLCHMFTSCDGPSAGPCPRGLVEHLEISQCRPDCLTVLTDALPTFFCLRSLNLHSFVTFTDTDVMHLARALRQLYESSRSSLTELSISALPRPELIEHLLAASPNITSLHVEIQSVWGLQDSSCHYWTPESAQVPLEMLTVKVGGFQTDVQLITSVLRRAPHLSHFHLAGMRLPTGSSQSTLLTTLSESNRVLRRLILEDIKLSDCLPPILNLLGCCRLEELHFADCRLLETWSDREEGLRQLVAALKSVPSLHTVALPQNRLGVTGLWGEDGWSCWTWNVCH
ncbi:uncharacterized protein lrrc41 isoform X2 [Takifugu rubripes]|uniref:uncharacterized protein lrrc41 isoform X2 n=1 Tax=Takifugu rubripes TaxID=31033 RepID=UPI0011453640|nr:leucine-rich repeat-containing protein 41 isoform X2 [Takifugu rubripes]